MNETERLELMRDFHRRVNVGIGVALSMMVIGTLIALAEGRWDGAFVGTAVAALFSIVLHSRLRSARRQSDSAQ